MIKKWNETSVPNKIMLVIRIIVSICVVVFAALQLFRVWDKAINLAAPLMGIVLLIQSIQEWKLHRGIASIVVNALQQTLLHAIMNKNICDGLSGRCGA